MSNVQHICLAPTGLVWREDDAAEPVPVVALAHTGGDRLRPVVLVDGALSIAAGGTTAVASEAVDIAHSV